MVRSNMLVGYRSVVMPAIGYAAEAAVDNKADVREARSRLDGYLQQTRCGRAGQIIHR